MCSFGRTCWCWWDRMHFFEELNMHTVWAGNIKGSKVVATGLFEILQQKETDFSLQLARWYEGLLEGHQMFPVPKNWQLLVPALAFLAQNYLRDALAYTPTISWIWLRSLFIFALANPPFGYGSIPIDTFLMGWTSIYQLFWGSLGTRVLTHPHLGNTIATPRFLDGRRSYRWMSCGRNVCSARCPGEQRHRQCVRLIASHVDQETCWEKTTKMVDMGTCWDTTIVTI